MKYSNLVIIIIFQILVIENATHFQYNSWMLKNK
jgi:hypothetical protein